MKRRTEDFEVVPGKLPDITRPGWGALRDYYHVVRAQKREAGKVLAELRANSDLTPEAQQRREAELREGVRKAIDPAWEALLTASTKVAAEIEAIIDQEANVDPWAAPEVRFSELDAAGIEQAKLSLALYRQTDRVARLLVDGQIDRMLDRAFARDTHKDGQPLFQLYERLVEAGDSLTLRAFENQGLARIRIEGSKATATALSVMVEAAVENRLPEAARELLDHRDALAEAVNISVAVHAETGIDDFLFGRSIALEVAGQAIGWVVEEEDK